MSPWRGMSRERFEQDRPLFEHFLDIVPDSVLGVDHEGNIVFANSQAERLFRASHDQLIGSPIETLIPKRFHHAHVGHRSNYFANPKTRPMGADLQLYARRLDGSEFPAEISLSSFDIGDSTIAAAAVRDVTERVRSESEHKRMEHELAENQSRRLESIGALAGGVAHDFNNLLGVIINYAELAAEAVDDPDVKLDIEQIQESAMRAATLTRQLLIFSRREVVNPVAIDLNLIVQGVETLLRRTIGEQIELRTTFGADIATVIADPGQLEQIIVNLAVNARDAMPHGGLLDIATSNVTLDDDYLGTQVDGPPPGKYVRISVSDSGVGMPADVRDRAFEPFFTTKAPGEGTGLGLATVYGIVQQAGGSVLIYSEPDHGTTVKIHLPASDATIAEWTADNAPAPQAGAGETILVVEDEDQVRRLVERLLREKGYAILTAANADEALLILNDEDATVDLMLTDVVMPGMQGNDLAARAQAVRPGLRVLLMSGYSEAIIDRIDGHRGGLDMVEKPFTRLQLLSAVSNSLSKVSVVGAT